jgi:hypothetical protein
MEGTKKGDTLRADRVTIRAMKIDDKGVVHSTGTHRGRLAIAERNVYCVVDREMIKAALRSGDPPH